MNWCKWNNASHFFSTQHTVSICLLLILKRLTQLRNIWTSLMMIMMPFSISDCIVLIVGAHLSFWIIAAATTWIPTYVLYIVNFFIHLTYYFEIRMHVASIMICTMHIVIFLFNKCFKYNFHYLQGYFWKIREIATNILNKIIIITVLLKISWNRNKFTK